MVVFIRVYQTNSDSNDVPFLIFRDSFSYDETIEVLGKISDVSRLQHVSPVYSIVTQYESEIRVMLGFRSVDP